MYPKIPINLIPISLVSTQIKCIIASIIIYFSHVNTYYNTIIRRHTFTLHKWSSYDKHLHPMIKDIIYSQSKHLVDLVDLLEVLMLPALPSFPSPPPLLAFFRSTCIIGHQMFAFIEIEKKD